MATTNRKLIFLSCVLSAIAVLVNLVSLSTLQWITARCYSVDGVGETNLIHYGLFQGVYKRNFPVSTVYELQMTCNFGSNVCALLCGLDQESRSDLLKNLFNNKIDTNYTMNGCPTISKYSYALFYENTPLRVDSNTQISKENFINAGVWLSTLIFLILAILFGIVSSALAFFNTVSNPIEYFLSVHSLYYYNSIAFCCTVFYMILFGVVYHIRIFHNIAIYDTLVGSMTSDKTAELGYSYWISFAPLVLYVSSIASLYYRNYLIERDPKHEIVDLDAQGANPNLYLY
ncbi:hypothetical protein ABEB36_009135 [Hypothenemus hampei]|uniref:Clarin-3 n=1 Tax=Hypothenemus hampei TaxID=57062 RepID=A0ABD1EP88_HYPHA